MFPCEGKKVIKLNGIGGMCIDIDPVGPRQAWILDPGIVSFFLWKNGKTFSINILTLYLFYSLFNSTTLLTARNNDLTQRWGSGR